MKKNYFFCFLFVIFQLFSEIIFCAEISGNKDQVKSKILEWKAYRQFVKKLPEGISTQNILFYACINFLLYSLDEYNEYCKEYCSLKAVGSATGDIKNKDRVFIVSDDGSQYICGKVFDKFLITIDNLPVAIPLTLLEKMKQDNLFEKVLCYILYSLYNEKQDSPFFESFKKCIEILKKKSSLLETCVSSYEGSNKDVFNILNSLIEYYIPFQNEFFPYFSLHDSYVSQDYNKKDNLLKNTLLLPIVYGPLSINTVIMAFCNTYFCDKPTKDAKIKEIQSLNAILFLSVLNLSGYKKIITLQSPKCLTKYIGRVPVSKYFIDALIQVKPALKLCALFIGGGLVLSFFDNLHNERLFNQYKEKREIDMEYRALMVDYAVECGKTAIWNAGVSAVTMVKSLGYWLFTKVPI